MLDPVAPEMDFFVIIVKGFSLLHGVTRALFRGAVGFLDTF